MRSSLIPSPTELVRNSVMRCLDLLPPELSAPAVPMPPEPMPPCQSERLISTEARTVMRAEAAALAPRRQAIAQAKLAVRTRRAASRATSGRDGTCAEPHAPERAPTAPCTGAPKPHAPIPPADPAAPAPTPAPDPRRGAPAVPARCVHETAPPEPHAPEPARTVHDAGAPKPHAPFPPAHSAAPAPSQTWRRP